MSKALTYKNSSLVLEMKNFVGINMFNEDSWTIREVESGKNVLKFDGYYAFSTGTKIGNPLLLANSLQKNTTYTVSGKFKKTTYFNRLTVVYDDLVLESLLETFGDFDDNYAYSSITFTTSASRTAVGLYVDTGNMSTYGYAEELTVQLELGSTAKPYSPYSPSALNTNSLIDRSRNANNGTFSNVIWEQLPNGMWVMSFNGVNSVIAIADSLSMRMTQGGTISVWIKANSDGEMGEGRIFDKSTGGWGTGGYELQFISNNRLFFNTGGEIPLYTSNNAIPFGIFKHIVIVFGSTGIGRKIYVDAVDVTANGGSETALPPDVASTFSIGNIYWAMDRTFDGLVNSLQMWDGKYFTQSEVTRLFNAERVKYGV